MNNAQHSFTLIELLVVISIIAILAGLIVPTYLGVRQNAKKVKARSTVKNLETAFKEYLNHYRIWPDSVVPAVESSQPPDGYPIDKDDNNLYEILRGDNKGGDNADTIAFFEFEPIPTGETKEMAYDPWNEPFKAYRVKFDVNYDNQIGTIYRSVLVCFLKT